MMALLKHGGAERSRVPSQVDGAGLNGRSPPCRHEVDKWGRQQSAVPLQGKVWKEVMDGGAWRGGHCPAIYKEGAIHDEEGTNTEIDLPSPTLNSYKASQSLYPLIVFSLEPSPTPAHTASITRGMNKN